MKRKAKLKKWCCFFLTIMLPMVLILSGCSSPFHKKISDSSRKNKIYYLNLDETGFETQDLSLDLNSYKAEDAAELLLEMLEEEPENSKMRRTIPENITHKGFSIRGEQITVDFPESFYNLTPVEDVLIRAAVVKTLTQIAEIDYVSFTVNGSAMVNKSGEVMGAFTPDDFLDSPEAAINTSITTDVTLYMTDEEGVELIPLSRRVTYNSSWPLEKVVMQQLILGTTTEGYRSTIPSGTKLISISVIDGVCYVNLDGSFLNDQKDDISEEVVLYSIVNSLTELDNIDWVQISVNGNTDGKIRYNFELNTLYQADMDIVRIDVKG